MTWREMWRETGRETGRGMWREMCQERWGAGGAFLPIGLMLVVALPAQGEAQRVPGSWVVEATGVAIASGVADEGPRAGGLFGLGREWRHPIGGPPAPGEAPPPSALLAAVAGFPVGAWSHGKVPVALTARAAVVWRVAAGPLNRLGGAAFGGVNPRAGGAALRLERDPVAAVQLGWMRLAGERVEEWRGMGDPGGRPRDGPFLSVELRGGFVRDQLRGLGW